MALEDSAPAERLGDLLGRLHPITRLVIAAGVLHLCGDALSAGVILVKHYQMSLIGGDDSLGKAMADIAHSLAYGLGFFGSAASIEYLFRIWVEVKALRAGDDKAG